MFLHELHITKRSYEVFNDLLLYPLFNVIVFGFMTLYLAGTTGKIVADQVLAAMILWQMINITQYSIAVGCLWDVWSRNLTNLFITPITFAEYLFSYAITGSVKAIVVMILASILSFFVFNFNIFSVGVFQLFLVVANLIFFGFSFGVVMLGLIIRFGTKIQAFAWGLISVFQPLMAVIYPVSVLPEPFKSIAHLFPPTYAFEAMRKSLAGINIGMDFVYAFLLNFVFLFLSIAFFRAMFIKSKVTGQFARLEG
jgi:ABC-2 type transport system permease protein